MTLRKVYIVTYNYDAHDLVWAFSTLTEAEEYVALQSWPKPWVIEEVEFLNEEVGQ